MIGGDQNVGDPRMFWLRRSTYSERYTLAWYHLCVKACAATAPGRRLLVAILSSNPKSRRLPLKALDLDHERTYLCMSTYDLFYWIGA